MMTWQDIRKQLRSFGVARDKKDFWSEDMFDVRSTAIHELQHRLLNSVAVIAAIVRETIRSSRNLEEFATSFDLRIAGLAKAHRLLVSNEQQPQTLLGVIHEQFDAEIAALQMTVGGPNVFISKREAFDLRLALFELMTNSRKHGCLAWESGVIVLEWKLIDELLVLRWIEKDGPVIVPPKREGEGIRLIRSLFGGGNRELSLNFDPLGFSCTLGFRLSSIEPVGVLRQA